MYGLGMKVPVGTLLLSHRKLSRLSKANLPLTLPIRVPVAIPPSTEPDSVKPGRRLADLRGRTALALQPRCSGHPSASPLSQAEALRLQETGLRTRVAS